VTAETPPFGHDQEFRGLFAEEARGRLDTLAAGLLALEEGTGDPELVPALLREAHTLKGGSAMVGLPRVTRLAHLLEDLLAPHRDGRASPPRPLVDEALAAVDGLRAVIDAAARGEDHAAEADAIEDRLVVATRPDGPQVEEGVAGGAADGAATAAGPAAEPGEAHDRAAPAVEGTPEPRPAASTIAVPVARLDELVRLVTESATALLRTGHVLGEAMQRDPSTVVEYRELSRTLTALQELAMRTRMVAVATVAHPLQRAVRDLARELGKEVRWELRGEDTELDRRVLDQLADPLLHLVRNAVDHGIEPPDQRVGAGKPRRGTVRLHAMQLGSEVVVAIGDDGRGIDVDAVRAAVRRHPADAGGADGGTVDDAEALYGIFTPGVSTAARVTDVSGRGVGLDIVRAGLQSIRGRVEVHNQPGRGCEFRISVPITLAVVPCLVVRSAGQRYAIPAHAVTAAVAADGPQVMQAGGRAMVLVDGRAVPLTGLQSLLGAPETDATGPALVLTGLSRSHAVRVAALEGRREVVLKGLGDLLPHLDAVAGAAIDADGSVLVVLEPTALIERGSRSPAAAAPSAAAADRALPAPAGRQSILVVDDAMTVRELERSILLRAGYEVRTAEDGVEALARLAEQPADLVLTDVEMPRMDGFALTEAIRAHPRLRNVAVVVVTSRASEEDRQRGLEAGADGYIVKRAFDQASLLAAVERLLGQRR
jgi:two-component system, chemotaxis family, sensor kinase CheA